ncbi:MAG: dTDP-glucose 4,6-dehydratase, partial [Firmicutes bacterium]|nr:dTDP-glucose 4,6-dehydratase [Bacillota bacterium]
LEGVLDHPRHRFVRGDIADRGLVRELVAEADAVVNFAAESHVDRSIADPTAFLRTNVLGTQVLLDAAREARVGVFVQVSTDEVYGSLGPEGRFTETSPLAPSSPYSASKAAADLLALAYHRTYGLPVVVTRSSNNFGPRQYPEKLIPVLVLRALEDRPLPLYGDGTNVRDWLYVEDNCRAIGLALRRGRPGEVYNVGAGEERSNLEVARAVLKALGKPESLITFVPDRPGHDFRYALDVAKARRELGWEPRWRFDDALAVTVDWYARHRRRWDRSG